MKMQHASAAAMTPAFDVIVCGSIHLDVVVDSPRLPRLDETVQGSFWKKICGGKGGNQAVMAAKSGATCAIIGRVGADDFGQTLVANLRSNTVNTDYVSVDQKIGTGMSVAIVERDGDYGAVIVSGSNLTLQPESAVAAWQKLGGAKILILQNEISEAVNIAVARAAKSVGACVLLNAAPALQLSSELSDLVDLLVVNRVEAEMMTGQPVNGKATALKVLSSLARKNKEVIITLGGLGLVFQTRDGLSLFVEPHKVTVRSTHGAGDCFIGVLAQALANGAELADACNKANLKAASFVAGRNL